jgi:hypothetical protein
MRVSMMIRQIIEPVIAVIVTWIALTIMEVEAGRLAAWLLGTFVLLVIGIIRHP